MALPPWWMLVGGTVFAIVASEMCSALISLMMTGEVSGVVWLAAFVAPAVVASAELVVLIAVIRHLRRKNQRLSEAEAALTRDIRERQDYEDGLRQAKQAAEEANAAKDRFLAMMSHEIRTPITSVLGMADLLYRTPLIEEQASYLGSLRSSARTLLTILNDILDFSKIEADKVVIEATCFHLRGAVREIVDLAQGTASAKGLCLEPILGEQAPAAVIGDPTRLKQVLLNLISNAIKFTESGTIRIRMSVKQELDEGVLVLFEVEDSGIGIAPEQRDILFTAFSQADQSTTRRFGGTGLGLSISKKLVELMGGEIGVQSEPGLGATFWFTLPFALGAGAVPPDLLPATPPPLPLPWRPLRILLAEDNRINLMLVRSMLQKFGHTVQVVENGRQAVDAVVAGDVDIVLMDMQMPEMDGEQATQAIRALPPPKNRLPVLAFTADVMAENRERYLRAGVNDLVAKPIDWETLSDALEAQTRIPVRAPVPAGTGST